jgi:hypothetical protein
VAKAVRAAVVVLFIMLVPGILVGLPMRAVAEAGPYEWTIAVYGDADNNLEGAWDKYTHPALMGIPANDKIKVVAAVDRFGTPGTEVVEYTYGSASVAAAYGEKDFGASETLTWFIQEVDSKYPSNRLAVIVWDHGGGWWGVCWDDTNHSYMTMSEMSEAITNAGVRIDILGFDACMMAGIEVVYEAYKTGLVGMMVASEQLVPYAGFPYDLMFSPLAADPSLDEARVADDMVCGWDMYYGSKGWVDLSALDVEALGLIVLNEFVAWKDALQADLGIYGDSYLKAFKKAEMVKRWYIVDINLFSDSLLGSKAVTDPALIEATEVLLAAIDAAVGAQSGGSKSPLSGVTLWFGIKGEYANYGLMYSTLTFAQDTGWYSFMTEVNGY